MPKFVVSYKRHMSTTNQEIETTGKADIKCNRKPTRKDFRAIEQALEDKFLVQHRRSLKNLLSISFRVKKVIG